MYSFNNNLFKSFKAFNINKLPYRAYFIPFSDEKILKNTAIIDERYKSDMVEVLSGEWDFKYYSQCANLPTEFDTSKEKFEKIQVPSTWQRTGFENPVYLNTRYMFKLNPPKIPTNIPVAVYRKTFDIASLDKNRILTFLGSAATLEVYLNDKFVGYGEGSHNSAEFDITKLLNVGANELVVVVHKWCNGSYLECQDMFRENGIFRDVYITSYPKSYLYDYSFTNKYVNGYYDFEVEMTIENPSNDANISIELVDKAGKVVAEKKLIADNKTLSFSFENLEVEDWSAEIPNLYTVNISLKNADKSSQFIRAIYGFKRVEIKGNVFYFNDKKLKIKGVNHHDTDSKNGWVMTNLQLENDIKIMKKYNCNGVRMSHYPPDPILVTLCDIYGLYVVDEMDIECHGIYCNPLNARFGLISNNLKWANQFLDRAKAMYYRDRNHCSIIMWSLGNEAGGYKCHDVAYDFFKSVSTIPVHYEGVIHTKRHSYDVVSQMYPSTNRVEKIGQENFDQRYITKPYFLCEYVHAMGVGPGAMEEYFNLFLEYDNLMGGCIWEFCDHAVYHENGKYKYTYGGDHGEKIHDGNFCVDGLFFPDRTPSSGALNMREVYRPLRAKLDGDKLTIRNTNLFRDSSDIAISYEVICNNQIINSSKIDDAILAGASKSYDVKLPENLKNIDCFVNVMYCNKLSKEYIAKEQITVCEGQYCYPMTLEMVSLDAEIKNRKLVVRFGNDGQVVFDKASGELSSYKIGDKEFVNQQPLLGKKGLLPNIYRGLIDNDRFIQILWKAIGYDKAKVCFRGCKAKIVDNTAKICNKYSLRFFGKIVGVKVCISIDAKGKMSVKATIKKGLKLTFYSELPRFGVTLEMPKQFENVEYYGLGESENLCDFTQHAYVGTYKTKVGDMHDSYVKPQESGNHGKVRYAKITDNDGDGLMFIHNGDYFNFNANHYVLKDLLKATHTEELVDRDTTNVQIDGYYRGAGTQSCGQGPLKQYKFDLRKPLTFEFEVKPIKNK